MNELKYQITQLIFLVLLGLGGYWALTHLDNGISYSRDQIVSVNETDSETIEKPIVVADPIADPEETAPVVSESDDPAVTPTPKDPSTSSLSGTEKELVSSLERLIKDDIYMKVGSRGTRVGSVQKFLAYYFTDQKVTADNEYGPGTKTLVEKFQIKEGLSPDGQAGPNTYQKMIDTITE